MKKRLLLFFFLYTGIVILPINFSLAQIPAKQVEIKLVKYMPNLPFPYKMKDWKAVVTKQDLILYDFNAKGTLLPLIWWDDNKVNFPIRSFGIYSYVGSE